MNWLRELGRRFGMLLHRHQFRADLEEEMQLHLDLRQLQQAEQGMPLDQAAFAARRRFGNVTVLKETSQLAWGWAWLESLPKTRSMGYAPCSAVRA